MSRNAEEMHVDRCVGKVGLKLRKSNHGPYYYLTNKATGFRVFPDLRSTRALCAVHTSLDDCKTWAVVNHPEAKMRRNASWKELIPTAADIVNSYDTGVTLRQLFYQLVSHHGLENNTSKYNYLSKLTSEARRDGWFPDLIDQSSEILTPQCFSSPEQARQHMLDAYRRNRTEGQEFALYLAVEKAGIQEQLWAWFGQDLGIPVLALGGYGSQTYKDQIKRHVLHDGRPAVLIYAGDHDASGDDIFRDLVERTDPGAILSDDYTTVTHSSLWTAVHRIALTKEQVEQENLPQNPGKDDDTRSESFMARHGYETNVQVELDALSPDLLRGLYREAIDPYWDADAYNTAIEREDEERDQL